MEVRSISQGGQFDIHQGMSAQDKSLGDNALGKRGGTENPKITEKDIKTAVDKFNKLLEDKRTHVEYEMHKELHEIMIKVVDDESKKVIKEIPPKKLLDMVAKFCEMAGILVDAKA